MAARYEQFTSRSANGKPCASTPVYYVVSFGPCSCSLPGQQRNHDYTRSRLARESYCAVEGPRQSKTRPLARAHSFSQQPALEPFSLCAKRRQHPCPPPQRVHRVPLAFGLWPPSGVASRCPPAQWVLANACRCLSWPSNGPPSRRFVAGPDGTLRSHLRERRHSIPFNFPFLPMRA